MEPSQGIQQALRRRARRRHLRYEHPLEPAALPVSWIKCELSTCRCRHAASTPSVARKGEGDPMNQGRLSGWLLAAAAIVLLAGAPAQAQQAASRSRVVVQVSDGAVTNWNLALNNVHNIQAELGAANVDIEVVAYGPGIGMLK